MANLVITNGCNLHCPFCFASEYRQEAAAATEMSWGEFCYQLDFVSSDTIRFCGGEPTLHGQFCKMVDYILEHGRQKIFIMTNGLWPEAVSSYFKKLSRRNRQRVYYMFNVLPDNHYSERERLLLEKNIKLVASDNCTLATTIYQKNPNFDYILELLKRYKIHYLRYSLAAPNISDQRSWHFVPDRDFPALGLVLTELLKLCLEWDVYLQGDCGYLPRCYWPKEGLYLLDKISERQAQINFNCQGPIDIGPDGQAWRCFGLKSLSKNSTRHFCDCGEMAEEIKLEEDKFRQFFLKDECRNCPHGQTGKCGGGCLALRFTMALQKKAEMAGFNLASDIELLDCCPARSAQIRLFKGPHGEKIVRQINGEWEELTLENNLFRLIAACDGKTTLEQLCDKLKVKPLIPDLLRQIRQLYAQELITLDLNLPPS